MTIEDQRRARRAGLASLSLAVLFVGGVSLGRTRWADGDAPSAFYPLALPCALGAFLLALAAISTGLRARGNEREPAPGLASGIAALALLALFVFVVTKTGALE